MLIIFITFLSLFAVLGLQFFIKSIIYEHISPKKIIIQTHNNENEIDIHYPKSKKYVCIK